MLNIEVQNGKAQIKASGSLKELTADLALVVSDIYSQLLQSNEDCAQAFRSACHLDGFGVCSVREAGDRNA